MAVELAVVASAVFVVGVGIGRLSAFHSIRRRWTSKRDARRFTAAATDEMLALYSAAVARRLEGEREYAKMLATLSLAFIAGVAALAQVGVVGRVVGTVLVLLFSLPLITSIFTFWHYYFQCRRVELEHLSAIRRGRPRIETVQPAREVTFRLRSMRVGHCAFCLALFAAVLHLVIRQLPCDAPGGVWMYPWIDENVCRSWISAFRN